MWKPGDLILWPCDFYDNYQTRVAEREEELASWRRRMKKRRTTTVTAAATPVTTMTTPGSTTIDHLCDSLLTEILLRLPLASAKRCQAVCKRWYALISDPNTNFISRFDRQQRENKRNFAFLSHNLLDSDLRLLVVSPSDEPYFYSDGFSLESSSSSLPKLPSPLLGCSAHVVASCHDLLLCRSRVDHKYAYYIYNPLTINCTKLPLPPSSPTIVLDVGLVCDYDNYSAAAATRTCTYKVVRIVRLGRGVGAIKVQIFSSDTGEWGENVVSCAPMKSLPGFYKSNGIPYNGLLFWLTQENRLMGLDPYNGGQFRRCIDLPAEFQPFRVGLIDGGFGVCNGKLRLFYISKDPILSIRFIRIWDLKGYKEEEEVEWMLEKQVYFRGMISKDSGWLTEAANTPDFSPLVLGCEPDDCDVLHIIIKQKDVLKVVMSNMHLRTLEEVCDIPLNLRPRLQHVFTYKLSWWPTLVTAPSMLDQKC